MEACPDLLTKRGLLSIKSYWQRHLRVNQSLIGSTSVTSPSSAARHPNMLPSTNLFQAHSTHNQELLGPGARTRQQHAWNQGPPDIQVFDDLDEVPNLWSPVQHAGFSASTSPLPSSLPGSLPHFSIHSSRQTSTSLPFPSIDAQYPNVLPSTPLFHAYSKYNQEFRGPGARTGQQHALKKFGLDLVAKYDSTHNTRDFFAFSKFHPRRRRTPGVAGQFRKLSRSCDRTQIESDGRREGE